MLWLFAVTFSEPKMLPLKMGLLSLGVYYISVNSWKDSYPTTTGKDFSTFFSGFTQHSRNGLLYVSCKCTQMYRLLPHHYWQSLFALVICSVTCNETKGPSENGSPKFTSSFLAGYVLFGNSFLPPGV